MELPHSFEQFGYNKEINMQIGTFVAREEDVSNKISPYLAFWIMRLQPPEPAFNSAMLRIFLFRSLSPNTVLFLLAFNNIALVFLCSSFSFSRSCFNATHSILSCLLIASSCRYKLLYIFALLHWADTYPYNPFIPSPTNFNRVVGLENGGVELPITHVG